MRAMAARVVFRVSATSCKAGMLAGRQMSHEVDVGGQGNSTGYCAADHEASLGQPPRRFDQELLERGLPSAA